MNEIKKATTEIINILGVTTTDDSTLADLESIVKNVSTAGPQKPEVAPNTFYFTEGIRDGFNCVYNFGLTPKDWNEMKIVAVVDQRYSVYAAQSKIDNLGHKVRRVGQIASGKYSKVYNIINRATATFDAFVCIRDIIESGKPVEGEPNYERILDAHRHLIFITGVYGMSRDSGNADYMIETIKAASSSLLDAILDLIRSNAKRLNRDQQDECMGLYDSALVYSTSEFIDDPYKNEMHKPDAS